MHVMALTGGIATGKSTAVGFLKELCPAAVVFDCDASVKGLWEDAGVLAEVRGRFGEEVVTRAGVDRSRLREVFFTDDTARRDLEGIFHPRVREECLALLRETAKKGASPLFVADVPLLFESGFDFGQELSLVVALSPETQKNRLKARDGHEDALVASILAAQLPILEKVRRGGVVFWNEGRREVLREQVRRLLKFYNCL